MKILYVTRLFSGLKDSIKNKKWEPTGVPTIYHMIEALDRGPHKVEIIFTSKELDDIWFNASDRLFELKGLSIPVTVLSATQWIPSFLGRARGYLRELRQTIAVWVIKTRFKPDLIYFDRGNIYPAACVAHLSRIPIVWRVMGVPAPMHETLREKGIVAWLTRLAYKSPFAMVICSRDGSGGEQWIEKALKHSVPRQMMLNGVDRFINRSLDNMYIEKIPKQKTKILFVARLVEEKGCFEFMRAFVDVLRQAPSELHAVIVGTGKYLEQMQTIAEKEGFSKDISFLGQVPHDQVLAIQAQCDIYVSLNIMCNLTNANLEAMRSGACMIIPEASAINGADLDTQALVPEDAVMRIPSAKDTCALTKAILFLHENTHERAERSKKTKTLAMQMIPTWRERIGEELKMLEHLAETRWAS